jgi:rhodanese-related sulfurtransferase
VEFLKQNWHWAALALASGTMLVIDLLRNSGGAESLSPVDATLKINREDAVVIDVRDQAEFAAGHIANARHIALADLPKRMGELEKLKSKPIILCCQSGARSAGAQATLKKAGFDKVFNLRGGIGEWQKAGQPVARKRK